jgi:hypothetical protein
MRDLPPPAEARLPVGQASAKAGETLNCFPPMTPFLPRKPETKNDKKRPKTRKKHEKSEKTR